MRSGGSQVVVRRVEDHIVVIDPTRDSIEIRRSKAAEPTPDDTVLQAYHATAVRCAELFVARDGSHRLVLVVGTREGIDLGRDLTRAQGLDAAKSVARLFSVSLHIRDGDYLECYFRESGPILSRIHDGRHLIEAELVDPIDPWDELSPWGHRAEVSYESFGRDGEGFSMDDLMIEIHGSLGGAYDDGPFAEPRVRTAPEVEAVFPLPTPIDPPPMSPEAEERVMAAHRPPRKPGFERRDRLAWLRAALKALTA